MTEQEDMHGNEKVVIYIAYNSLLMLFNNNIHNDVLLCNAN